MSTKSTKTDLARIDRMTDKDIDYSDIPALDNSFFTRPTVEWPSEKKTNHLPRARKGFVRRDNQRVIMHCICAHSDILMLRGPVCAKERRLRKSVAGADCRFSRIGLVIPVVPSQEG